MIDKKIYIPLAVGIGILIIASVVRPLCAGGANSHHLTQHPSHITHSLCERNKVSIVDNSLTPACQAEKDHEKPILPSTVKTQPITHRIRKALLALAPGGSWQT
jgi:hypothetical protein